jgi:hypothetical protein
MDDEQRKREVEALETGASHGAGHEGSEVPVHLRVTPGMEVVGADGESVGLVKAVAEGHFLLDRVMRRDLYVPLDMVQGIDDTSAPERVVLKIPAAEVAVMDWESPPVA